MPTYAYACQSCGHDWEVEQRIVEEPIKKCPRCRKSTARRQIQAATFILRGGGWYADGYSAKRSTSTGGDSSPSAGSKHTDPPGPGKGGGSSGASGTGDGAKGGADSGKSSSAPKGGSSKASSPSANA